MKIKVTAQILMILASLFLLSCVESEHTQVVDIDTSKRGLLIEARNQTHPDYSVANFSLAEDNHHLIVNPGDVIKFSFSYIYLGQKNAFITLPGGEVRELAATKSDYIEWTIPKDLKSETKITAVSTIDKPDEGSTTELIGEIFLIKKEQDQ